MLLDTKWNQKRFIYISTRKLYDLSLAKVLLSNFPVRHTINVVIRKENKNHLKCIITYKYQAFYKISY